MVERQPLERYLGVAPELAEARVLRLLLETGIHLIHADEGSLLAYEPEKRALRFVMTAGSRGSERSLLGQRVPVGKGLSGLAAASGEVQIGAPTYHDIEQRRRRDGHRDEPEAVIAAPIQAGETLLGVITAVSFAEGRRFSHDDGKLMGRFGAIAGLVLHQHHRLNLAPSPAGDQPERAIHAALERIRRERPDAMADFARAVDAIAALLLREPPRGADGTA